MQTELMAHAQAGRAAGVLECLEQAGLADQNGRTALMLAADRRRSDCVKLLLQEAGRADHNRKTALMRAAANGDLESVALLLSEAGRKDNNGRTALMLAAEQGHAACARLLLSELGHKNKFGWTALMLAARGGHLECAKLLMQEVRGADKAGITALMFSAVNGHADCVRLLMVETKMTDTLGQTALMLATLKMRYNVIPLLLCEAGMSTAEGWMALAFSMQHWSRGKPVWNERLLQLEAGLGVTKGMRCLDVDNCRAFQSLFYCDQLFTSQNPSQRTRIAGMQNPLVKELPAAAVDKRNRIGKTQLLRWALRHRLLRDTKPVLPRLSVQPRAARSAPARVAQKVALSFTRRRAVVYALCDAIDSMAAFE